MEKNNSKKTTISLSEGTKNQLNSFAEQKGESYDTILQRVISNAETLCKKKSESDNLVTEEDMEEME